MLKELLAEHSSKYTFWQMAQIDDVVVLWELQNEPSGRTFN